MPAFGTLKAKVLIQIGEGEPIEVGVMDIDLVAKPQPVKRGNRGAEVSIQVSPALNAEATARRVVTQISRLSL